MGLIMHNDSIMTNTITKLMYETLQTSKSLIGLAHKEVSTRLMTLLAPEGKPATKAIPPGMLKDLQSSIELLLQADWDDVERGIYPASLLFDTPWLNWISIYPLLCLDMPVTWNRRKRHDVRDLPSCHNNFDYPNYYMQNFHHQTDGYLSDHSANIYDLQVEILFNGTADVMRRRILSPLISGLKKFDSKSPWQIQILDIATGTGRTLHQISMALPHAQLIGIDLSAPYLRQANYLFTTKQKELFQLIQGNAERLPFGDNTIEGVTCVFLLHELPAEVRQNVLNECFRIIKSGGVLVLADSVQLSDSSEFTVAMENFRSVFHEPYYYSYINDNIDKRLEDAGFNKIKAKSYFMTRVWSATKPG
uniref:Generic methyl-transferase n=1 Tax=Paulinella chromatophora TaxID=39717 RepID=B1X427_PAUCH|nr:generic methyl-transferase [Paulinella chromatophora]ACB42696.1 generic methyl-transferase [Paulinella chromatophora]